MKTAISVLPNGKWTFFYRIGACPKCMRESFLASIVGYVLLSLGAAAKIAFHFELAFGISLAISIGLAALWMLHVLVFAVRRVRWRPTIGGASAREGDKTFGRRNFMAHFVRAVGLGVLATMLPSVASAIGECGSQQTTCNFTSCNLGGTTCCPLGYLFLSACDCKCYRTQADVMATGCRTLSTCDSPF